MSSPPPDKPTGIDQALLRRARNLARQNRRSVLAELELLHPGGPQVLVQELADLFGMVPIDGAALRAMTPAFDLLPLTLAFQWGCLLVREADGSLSGVLADPFDPDLQLWLNSQAHGPVLMRLTSSKDLRACLGQFAVDDHGNNASGRVAGRIRRDAEPDEDLLGEDGDASAQVLDATREILRRAMQR